MYQSSYGGESHLNLILIFFHFLEWFLIFSSQVDDKSPIWLETPSNQGVWVILLQHVSPHTLPHCLQQVWVCIWHSIIIGWSLFDQTRNLSYEWNQWSIKLRAVSADLIHWFATFQLEIRHDSYLVHCINLCPIIGTSPRGPPDGLWLVCTALLSARLSISK